MEAALDRARALGWWAAKLAVANLAVLVLAGLLPACKPAARGLCKVTDDCRTGQLCAVDGICLAQSGDCRPACADFELCTEAVCQPLRPVVTIALAADGLVSPAHKLVAVQVDATQKIKLGALHLEIATDHALAQADLAAAQSGRNALSLSGFEAGFEGQATLVATLQFTKTDGTVDQVRSIAVPATYDAAPPAIASIFLPAGQGEVNGWLPAQGPAVEVRAQVVDGAGGSGAASATLKLDVCPANAACSYDGTSVLLASANATFSFQVPRVVQPAGSEAPVGFTVTAVDRAGNTVASAGRLLIDAKAPAIGALRLVTTGALGEDGNTWFAAGAGAAPVEIAVPLDEAGVGLDPATVSLQLNPADVDLNPGPIAATFPTPADGAAHFTIPAATVVTAREGRVRLVASAKDRFGQAAAAPAQPLAIFLDAVQPVVSLAHADLPATTPAWSAVCGPDPTGSLVCGRGPQTAPTAALRDDTASVTVDVLDCGAGLAAAGGPAAAVLTATTGGHVKSVNLVTFAARPGTCANGSANPVHRYTAQLQLASDLPDLGPPNALGLIPVALSAAADDRLGHHAVSPPPSGTSGDGTLPISLVRWKRQLAVGSSLPAAGSPLLVPRVAVSSAGRNVVLPLAATSPAVNLVSVKPDGSQAWGVALEPRPQGDVAAAPSGLLFAPTGVSDPTCSSGPSPCGTVWVLPAPASAAAPTPIAVNVQNVIFGAPLAVHSLGGGVEIGFAVPTTRTLGENIYAFKVTGSSVAAPIKATVLTGGVTGDTFQGVTAADGQVFVNPKSATGFSSIGFSGTAFDGSGVNLDTSVKVVGTAPPSVLTGSDVKSDSPFFPADDGRVRRTDYSNSTSVCGALSKPCWEVTPAWATSGGQGATSPKHTPVFDKDQVVQSDGSGVVTSWRSDNGNLLWQLAPPGDVAAAPVSPPILLKAASGGQISPALVVAADGSVRRIQPPASGTQATALTLVKVGAFDSAATPLVPVLDPLGSGSVAYVADGAGWLWAVQLDDAPLPANASESWPRPGRDSCNSRSAASTCP